MHAPKFIDLTTDFGFKRIFGSETSKEFLKSFLNELFHGRKHIADFHYGKNEHVGDAEEIGTVIFDLVCTAVSGETFLIEVQRSTQRNLKRRMLYYGSKLIADMAPKGNRLGWNYAISEIYIIVLLDGFPMPDHESDGRYMHEIGLCDTHTGKVFYKQLGYTYIELVKFDKEEVELQSDLDRWLYVLKNMSKLKKLSVYLRKPIFERLFDIAAYTQLNKEERNMYDVSLKRKWDAFSIRETQELDLADAIENGLKQGLERGLEQGLEQGLEKGLEQGLEQGLEKGLEQGLQQGLEQGLEKGLEKGLEEGERRKAAAIALQLKKMGFSVIDIAEGTGLSVAEIEAL